MAAQSNAGMAHANKLWSKIRKALRAGKQQLDLIITTHARQRMYERNISEIDIRSCLQNGRVTQVDMNAGHARAAWQIEGPCRDENMLVAVVIREPDPDADKKNVITLVVITCWKPSLPS